MPDAIFGEPRLAAIYDALDPDRVDLDAYVAMATEFGTHRVLDLGCGTGVLALMLADRGLDVTGVDPAAASLDVARAKAGSERVRWIVGDASAIPAVQVDLVTMTANTAQAVLDPVDWAATIREVRGALRPDGRFAFETRDPTFRGWAEWNRADSNRVTDIEGVGAVESWVELLEVALPLVTFRWTYVFESDGAILTSDSTLRFRPRDEVAADLTSAGFVIDEVRDAPDRPGRELVFIARRRR